MPRAARVLSLLPLSIALLSGTGATLAPVARADIDIQVTGVPEDIRRNVLVFLSLERYRTRDDLDEALLARLQERAEREAASALRPFGYYEPTVTSEVVRTAPGEWRARVAIDPGKPVILEDVSIEVTGPGVEHPAFRAILDTPRLRRGERLNHATYDGVKSELRRLAATLGYAEAKLTANEMLVDLASHSARIRLALETGPRYSFGATGVRQESLDEDFLRRYLRYREAEPYDATQLLRTQFALDDSQYFSTVEVVAGEPDRERLVIPVDIRAEPNRRNRYSVGVGYATDSKARGTLTWDNRRLNDRGHRLRAELKAAQVEQSIEGRYVIPIGDPALEKFSLEARYGREDRGDLETSTLRFQPSVTQVLGDWQRVAFVSLSRVTTVTAATATQPESSDSNRLIIPGLSYASVPRGYLGEALFSRGFFAELRGSTTALGAADDFIQLRLEALWALTHSEATLQALVRNLPQRFGSVERLAVTGVQGTLAGGLRIASLEVEHDVAAIRVRDLRLRIDTLPLLWQTIEVRGFEVAELRIEQRPRDQPPPERAPRFLPGMLTLWTEQARIRRIVIQPQGGNEVELRDLEASGTLYGKVARIRKASVKLYDLHVEAQGLITSDLPLDLEGTATATYSPAQGPRWVIDARIDGDLDGAVVEGGIREPFRADLEDGGFRALSPWHLKGRAKVTELDLAEFGGGKALGILSGELALELDKEAYIARGTLDSSGLGVGPVAVDVEAMYAQRVLELRRADLRHIASGTRAYTAGTVTLLEGDQRIALSGRWEAFRWPLTGTAPVVKSPQGRFTLAGTGPYAITSEGRIEPAGLPPVDERIAGVLHPDRLEVQRSELRALGGRAELVGEVSWGAREAWRFKGPVRGLNPAQLRPDLPGSLDFMVDARGTGFGAAQVIDVDIRDLKGRLRGTPARGSGSLRYARDTLAFKRVDLSAGGFRLALDGELSPRRRDIDFRVATTDLGVLAAGARGSLRATGSLRGTPAAMMVEAEVDGRDISIQGIDIERLEADIDIDPTGDPTKPARAQVLARGIAAYGQSFQRLTFGLDGPVADHALRLDLDGEDIALEASGRGAIRGDRWSQRWEKAELALPADIDLSLVEPLQLALAPGVAQAERFCMQSRANRRWSAPSTLCAEGGTDAAGWRAKGEVRGLPLASLLDPPSPRASYAGTFDASADLRGRGDGPPVGTLRVELNEAALRWQRTGAKDDLIALGTGLLAAESTAEGIDATLKLTAGDRGRVDGTLRARHAAGDWRAMPMEATLRADSSALVLLHLYVPEIDRAAGALSLDLVIGGTLGAPLVNGVMRLERGELDFYQFNTALRDVNAEARLIDNGFTLTSTARLGEGRIAADAELEWRGRQPYGQLTVKGEDLLLVDVPEATIKASPDLKFRVAGRDLVASGTVRVPSARIAPADLTGAVLPSADEVLVGEEPDDPEAGFRVSSNIRLVLGDKVTVEALGLAGRLAGTLNVITQPDGTSRGSGELGVAEGKYMALGRRLDIERGRLLFTGGALNDPGVDIRATKEFPDVKAGVNVRGTLGEPRMSFFAEPSLPQSQIVSLLLAGGSVEGTQANDAAAGRAALIAQGGAILAQQLGQRIGIEDVGIEQNLANETSLVFGKYLSTRLYVSYGISLAEAINTLKLRYTINDRWTIKFEAGKEASTDIVYTVEKR